MHAVEAGVLGRDDVTQLGDVVTGSAQGRRSDDDITVFDSTGLAIQDLAIALAAMERAVELTCRPSTFRSSSPCVRDRQKGELLCRVRSSSSPSTV